MISAALLERVAQETAVKGAMIELQGPEDFQGQHSSAALLELGVDPEAFAEFSAKNVSAFYETVQVTKDPAQGLAMLSMFGFMVGLRCGREEEKEDGS